MKETIIALLVALRAVESSCGMDPKCKGNEYQLTRAFVEDVNRIYNTNYTWPKCAKNRDDSEIIIIMYLSYYGCRWAKKHGRIPDAETLARIYHCGPTGAERDIERGNRYCQKIRKEMK